MPLGYLMTAMFFGVLCAVLWLATGGTALTAFGVYLLSGNLVMGAMLAQDFLRDDH